MRLLQRAPLSQSCVVARIKYTWTMLCAVCVCFSYQSFRCAIAPTQAWREYLLNFSPFIPSAKHIITVRSWWARAWLANVFLFIVVDWDLWDATHSAFIFVITAWVASYIPYMMHVWPVLFNVACNVAIKLCYGYSYRNRQKNNKKKKTNTLDMQGINTSQMVICWKTSGNKYGIGKERIPSFHLLFRLHLAHFRLISQFHDLGAVSSRSYYYFRCEPVHFW